MKKKCIWMWFNIDKVVWYIRGFLVNVLLWLFVEMVEVIVFVIRIVLIGSLLVKGLVSVIILGWIL